MSEGPPIDPWLLQNLRCPKTGEPLRWASAEDIEALHRKLKMLGEVTQITGALITEKGTRAFLVQDGIPNMILEDSLILGSKT